VLPSGSTIINNDFQVGNMADNKSIHEALTRENRRMFEENKNLSTLWWEIIDLSETGEHQYHPVYDEILFIITEKINTNGECIDINIDTRRKLMAGE
jgi:hypothetical protein